MPVTTIAFGTDAGTLAIPGEPGVTTPVPVDRDALRRIAEATGRDAFEAATGAELRSVYEDIGSSAAHAVDGRDLSSWCFGPALVLVGAAAVLSARGSRRVAPGSAPPDAAGA